MPACDSGWVTGVLESVSEAFWKKSINRLWGRDSYGLSEESLGFDASLHSSAACSSYQSTRWVSEEHPCVVGFFHRLVEVIEAKLVRRNVIGWLTTRLKCDWLAYNTVEM